MEATRDWRILRTILFTLILAMACPCAQGRIIYVDDDATGANDGTSWADAYIHLQGALAAASGGDEIRAAQGLYRPDQGTGVISGDQTARFQLVSGVAIYGGYAGVGATDPDARDVEQYKTVLSGDLNGDDAEVAEARDLLTELTRADNSYHVVNAMETDVTAVLDGVTIAAGNADGTGPGSTAGTGGGMLAYDGSPTLVDCTFVGNSAVVGAGMNIDGGCPTLTNCTFSSNAAVSNNPADGVYGGGLFIHGGDPTLTDCTFNKNWAGRNGGGMINSGNPTLTDCTFSENAAGESGGGMYNERGDATLINCTFTDNSTQIYGGGMGNQLCSPTLTDCVFTGNISANGGAVCNNTETNATYTNCVFNENAGSNYGGGMYNDFESHPVVTDCLFSGNDGGDGGGGIANNRDSSATVTNCVFTGNRANGGGGVYNRQTSNPAELVNCIFTGNQAKGGGGLRNDAAIAILTNCTFSGNSSGGIFNQWDAELTLTNCILWHNRDAAGVDELAQIHNEADQGILLVDYSCIQGWTGGLGGIGNMDADPLFADPGHWDPNGTPEDANDDFWVDGDYHLKSEAGRWNPVGEGWVQDDASSPCIDGGDPDSPLAYEPFPNGVIINMGAYGGTAEASKSFSGLHSRYSGGSGTLEDPYKIATAENLNDIGNHQDDLDKHFVLVNDIDLSEYTGTQFNIIGQSDDSSEVFTGSFDGRGHRIRNFTYHSDESLVGLFGHILGAHIRDLGLESVDVSGFENVGALAGSGNASLVSGCYVTGKVAGDHFVGGLIGRGSCHVTNCYAFAEVQGISVVAGLVGANDGGMIDYCYTAGNVVGDRQVGGLTLASAGGAVMTSYWDIQATGQTVGGDGKGRTTEQMKQAQTFLGWNACGQAAWTLAEGNDYPRLAWEGRPGDPVGSQPLSDFVTGSGSQADPYLVSTAEQMNLIGLFPCEWDKYFLLIEDIDLATCPGVEFNRIGINHHWPFSGVFDGNRHTISHFTYDSRGPWGYSTEDVGLFCAISADGVVRDLSVTDVNVAGYQSVGGIVGRNCGGLVSGCCATGWFDGDFRVGGLVGWNEGTVTSCWTTGSITFGHRLGGLVGENSGILSDCYASADVSAAYDFSGSGGLTGDNSGTILNCYASGQVSGAQGLIGGLVGQDLTGVVTGSFWDVQTSGQTAGAGGEGKTTAQMQTAATFLNAGWDFVVETNNGTDDLWWILEGQDYPRLWWQPQPGGGEPPSLLEDFETGDLRFLDWKRSGDAWWRISTMQKHSGSCSARAGEIDAGESTSLSVTLPCAAGQITFWRKVSCITSKDYLEFCIDGERRGVWAGLLDWEQVSLPVDAGEHTFTWTYVKTASWYVGYDTAWIDDIVFPAQLE